MGRPARQPWNARRQVSRVERIPRFGETLGVSRAVCQCGQQTNPQIGHNPSPVDSSGFSTGQFTRWLDVKYGKQKGIWIKAVARVAREALPQ